MRQFVRDVLCKYSYAVIEAASPEQALAVAQRQKTEPVTSLAEPGFPRQSVPATQSRVTRATR